MGYETSVPVIHPCSFSRGMGAYGIGGPGIMVRHKIHLFFSHTYNVFLFYRHYHEQPFPTHETKHGRDSLTILGILASAHARISSFSFWTRSHMRARRPMDGVVWIISFVEGLIDGFLCCCLSLLCIHKCR